MNIERNFNKSFSSIEQITGIYLNNQNTRTNSVKADNIPDFEQILNDKRISNQKTAELKFSKHAGIRLEQRNISLSDEQLNRLKEGTKKACEKGIKESLMIMDDMTFIVNVKSNTVITAMDRAGNNENVFTNIDGAVIV